MKEGGRRIRLPKSAIREIEDHLGHGTCEVSLHEAGVFVKCLPLGRFDIDLPFPLLVADKQPGYLRTQSLEVDAKSWTTLVETRVPRSWWLLGLKGAAEPKSQRPLPEEPAQ